MQYDVSLTIEYTYEQASNHARSLLHLLPIHLPGQQEVTSSLLTVDPIPSERWEVPDFFGNLATWLAFHQSIVALRFHLEARLLRTAAPLQMDLSCPLDRLKHEVAGYRSIAPAAPHHFLGPSPRVAHSPSITRFGSDHLAPGTSTLQAVLDIGHALHAEMEFDDTATDVLTSPDEAFTLRRGVCQDFAHIMIACLRGLGIPAGYVSGFLRTEPPPGQARLEGADAMHAWVRAWCGVETGWIEYDPTNNVVVGEDHIVVGYGRDYGDVAPVRGTMRSSGGHGTAHFVDVVPS